MRTTLSIESSPWASPRVASTVEQAPMFSTNTTVLSPLGVRRSMARLRILDAMRRHLSSIGM